MKAAGTGLKGVPQVSPKSSHGVVVLTSQFEGQHHFCLDFNFLTLEVNSPCSRFIFTLLGHFRPWLQVLAHFFLGPWTSGSNFEKQRFNVRVNITELVPMNSKWSMFPFPEKMQQLATSSFCDLDALGAKQLAKHCEIHVRNARLMPQTKL